MEVLFLDMYRIYNVTETGVSEQNAPQNSTSDSADLVYNRSTPVKSSTTSSNLDRLRFAACHRNDSHPIPNRSDADTTNGTFGGPTSMGANRRCVLLTTATDLSSQLRSVPLKYVSKAGVSMDVVRRTLS